MLQRFFGVNSRKRKEDEEKAKRVEILRDLSAFRKTCKDNIKAAYDECEEGVKVSERSNDRVMGRMAMYNASLVKSNETLLRKCDNALLNLQTGDLRRKGTIADHLNKMEFNASYRDAKKSARKSNVGKLRQRALKMEKYRAIRNNNRALINDSLQDDLDDIFEDDSDDDSDAVEFVNCVKEKLVMDDLLAVPKVGVTNIKLEEMENDRESGVHDDV